MARIGFRLCIGMILASCEVMCLAKYREVLPFKLVCLSCDVTLGAVHKSSMAGFMWLMMQVCLLVKGEIYE